MKSDAVIKAFPEEIMKPGSEKGWDIVAKTWSKWIIDRLNIPREGEHNENVTEATGSGNPVFIFSNHISWADHFLIMMVINDLIDGMRVSALCKEKYYRYPVFGWILRRTNQIPITNVKLCFARWFKQAKGHNPRQRDFIDFMTESGTEPSHEVNVLKRQSLVRTAINTREMLERGRPIIGYPEGTRSQRGAMQPIKTGIMQLPFESKGLIVPTAVSGTDKILPKGIKFYNIFKFLKLDAGVTIVRYGPAISYTELLDKCEKKFERIDDMVNLENVRMLRELIEKDEFRAYTVEAERFERIFDESSLIIMRAVNEMLPEEYRTEQVEIKYPR